MQLIVNPTRIGSIEFERFVFYFLFGRGCFKRATIVSPNLCM